MRSTAAPPLAPQTGKGTAPSIDQRAHMDHGPIDPDPEEEEEEASSMAQDSDYEYDSDGGGAPDGRALPEDHPYARLIERFVDDNAAHERRLERDRDRGARTSGRSPWRGDRARLAE